MKLFKLLLIIGFLSPSLGFAQSGAAFLDIIGATPSGATRDSTIISKIDRDGQMRDLVDHYERNCEKGTDGKIKSKPGSYLDNAACDDIRLEIKDLALELDYYYRGQIGTNTPSMMSRRSNPDSGSTETLAQSKNPCEGITDLALYKICSNNEVKKAKIPQWGILGVKLLDSAVDFYELNTNLQAFKEGNDTRLGMEKIVSQNSIATGNTYFRPEMYTLSAYLGTADPFVAAARPNVYGINMWMENMNNNGNNMMGNTNPYGQGSYYGGAQGMQYMSPFSNAYGMMNYANGFNTPYASTNNTGRNTGSANLNIIN